MVSEKVQVMIARMIKGLEFHIQNNRVRALQSERAATDGNVREVCKVTSDPDRDGKFHSFPVQRTY